LPTAVDIGPSISGILKNIANPRAVGFAPDNIMSARTEDRTDRQRQAVRPQKAHYGSSALQLPQLGEDELETGLHLFIGIENDRSRAVVGEPGRQWQAEFTA
jgi:hypothetical protein